jgi:hypothetical protein
VRVGVGTNPLPLRLVGAQTPKGYGYAVGSGSPLLGIKTVSIASRWQLK